VEHARQAHALAPREPLVTDTLGWLLVRAGRAAEGAPLLERCAAELQRDPVVQYHAGIALARVKRLSDARLHLERALRLSTDFEGAETARAELERLR
jgi:cellulose synthase operon protein C